MCTCAASNQEQEEINLLDSLNVKITHSLLLQIAVMYVQISGYDSI